MSESGSSDPLTITAIVISITSLVMAFGSFLIASAQVLQQYSATAEGYRNCNALALGSWSRFVRRGFVWRQWRFVVTFQSPVLWIGHPGNTRGPLPNRKVFSIDGSQESSFELGEYIPTQQRSMNEDSILAVDQAQVSWLTVLAVLSQAEQASKEWDLKGRDVNRPPAVPEYKMCIQFQRQRRSYDMMPAPNIRPFASTTITDLLQIVATLGLSWSSFDTIAGNINAQGNGMVLSSWLVQGLGLCVTFLQVDKHEFTHTRVIPTQEIRHFVFGMVRVVHWLSESWATLIGFLDCASSERFRQSVQLILDEGNSDEPGDAELFSKDVALNGTLPQIEMLALVGMLAVDCRITESHFTHLPNPFDEPVPENIAKLVFRLIEPKSLYTANSSFPELDLRECYDSLQRGLKFLPRTSLFFLEELHGNMQVIDKFFHQTGCLRRIVRQFLAPRLTPRRDPDPHIQHLLEIALLRSVYWHAIHIFAPGERMIIPPTMRDSRQPVYVL